MASFNHPRLVLFMHRALNFTRLSVFGLCMASAVAAADNLQEAQRLMKQNQYADALIKVEAHLKETPKDATARFLKGLLLGETGRSAEAIQVMTALIEDYPELPEPYNNLAVLYARQNQYDQARNALEMAVRAQPDYSVAYENLGDVYAKLASQAYDKARQLDPKNSALQRKLIQTRDLVTNVPVSSNVAASHSKTGTGQLSANSVEDTQEAARPVLAAKPATEPAAVKPLRTDKATAEAEILKTLEAWSSAWTNRDMETFLAFYAPQFVPPQGLTREAWEAERRVRFTRPAWIKLEYIQPEIRPGKDGKSASVRFRLGYTTPEGKTTFQQMLELKKVGNTWQITRELSKAIR